MNRQRSPPDPNFKRVYRMLAWFWTHLIIGGCLTPGTALPKVDVPLADKWTHFVMFGGFTLLWLLADKSTERSRYIKWIAIGLAFGAAIEGLQYVLTFLKRSAEWADWYADGIGCVLGALVYGIVTLMLNRKRVEIN